ncbi:MAG: helix-turn-helix domain-containing protein [Candidatus Omnitrophica bacterium]|nr:helix-turn-helix domain-containing protein [Candidatus Omnitrophota bacterium]
MVKTINEPVLKKTWPAVEQHLSIHTKQDYNNAIAVLNRLLDEVGDNDRHPLYGFLEILGIVIENYETEHHHWEDASGVEVLKVLMEEHNLNQADLPEIGSQGVVSEILNGKRQLNVNQIKKLAERFNVGPAVFL